MKSLICLGFALAFVQAAVGQERGGPYMGFSVGSFSYEESVEDLDVSIDDTTTMYRILGGYRFSDNFALEGGWSKTGDIEESAAFLGIPFNVGAEFEVLTVRALAMVPFERTSLLGGVGYYDSDIEVSVVVPGIGSGSESTGEDGVTLVGGFEFNLERVDIRTELEWFDIDEGDAWDVSVGVLFSF
jgi:outer membrane protein with beta-barrel domain